MEERIKGKIQYRKRTIKKLVHESVMLLKDYHKQKSILSKKIDQLREELTDLQTTLIGD